MAVQEFELIFSQGVDGYSGVLDTMLLQNTAATSYGNATSVSVDSSPNSQVLLRFDDIFASDRIPSGATILSATLTLNTTNAGDGGSLHRMLSSWSESSTWNSLASGVSLNGVEALAAADVSTGRQGIGTSTIDVTSSVQAWADGAANYGWVISSLGRNGWDFTTSEGGVSPQLVVRFQVGDPPPPPENRAPVANPDAATAQKNGSININVLGNDTDADGHTLIVTSVGSPSNGTAQLGSNNQITYTPAPQFVGTDTFAYAISDGNGGTASSNVTVNVQDTPPPPPENRAPVANPDAATAQKNGSININVLGNDTDADGHTLIVTSVGSPSNGTAQLGSNNQITYTPAPQFVGTDTFAYAISDGNGGTASSNVTVNVQDTPPPPPQEFELIFSQGVDGYSGVLDTMLLQNTAATSYGNATSVSVDSSPNSQVLLRFDDIFASDRIPSGATILSATLTLNTTNAGDGGSLHRMLSSWSESSTWNSLASGVSLNGVEALAAADVSTGRQGIGTSTIDVTSSVQAWADGAANYGWVISSLGRNGWDFTTSEGGVSPQLVVRFQVGDPPPPPENRAPVANPDAATAQKNGSININVLGNDTDADGHTLIVTSVGSPSNGTAQLGSNNQITYTPAPQFVGTDTFAYAISDGNGGTASSNVTVNVQDTPPPPPENRAPVANPDAATAQKNGSININVLGNDTDADGHTLIVTSVGSPSNGTAQLGSNNQITYTPAPQFVGTDTFAYAISDGNGGTASSNVTVNVQDTPPPPPQEFELIFSQGVDGYSGVLDTMLLQNTAATSYGNATSVSVDSSPNSQVLLRFDDIFASDRIPSGATILSATLTLNTTNAGDGGSLHRMLSSWSESSTWNSLASGVSLNGVEALAAADVSTGRQGIGTSTIDVTSSVQAWADGAANYGWVISSLGRNGWDFTTSEGGVSPQLVVRFQVGDPPPPPENRAPVANPDAATAQKNGSININVLGNDTDADGHTLIVTSVGSPSNGTAQLGSNNQITYTPAPQFVGTDTFAYAISDGNGGTSSASVSVTVNPTPGLNFDGTVGYIALSNAAGSTSNFEHTNASKSFFHDGTWWSILPASVVGEGNVWSIYQFSETLPNTGALGGWSIASDALLSSSYHADIAWDAGNSLLYVLMYGANSADPYLFQMSYNAQFSDWSTDASVNLTNWLDPQIYGSNDDLAIGVDQFGNPLILAIDSGATQGLHLAYSASSDLNSWTSTLLDGNTTSAGGSNGNSKADFVYFSDGGVESVGIVYSQDSSSDSWRFAWHDATDATTAYSADWSNEVITSNVSIDDHVSAVSHDGKIYAAVKDASNALWLLSGSPGEWDTPIQIVSAGQGRSRPIVTLDETNDRLYVAYQQSTSPSDVFIKIADLNDLYFDARSSGLAIIRGQGSADNFINPQAPAHPVGADTDGYFPILVRESDGTHIWYNGIMLSDYDLIA